MRRKIILIALAAIGMWPCFAQTGVTVLGTTLPDTIFFRLFFERVAGAPEPLRSALKNDAALSDDEFAFLGNVAAKCNIAYEAESRKGVAAITAARQQYPFPAATAPPPLQSPLPAEVLAQLKTLLAQRDRLITDCASSLASRLGPTRFQAFRDFVIATEMRDERPDMVGTAALTRQAVHGPELVIGSRLLHSEAWRLERLYGKAVTYEDPMLQWSGDMGATGGAAGVFPRDLTLVRPADQGDDPGPILAKTLDAYLQQTDGPRFKVIESKHGLHIVPTEVRDETGEWKAAVNPLDAKISVPLEERTAQEHFVALMSQVSSATGIEVQFAPTATTRGSAPDPFEEHFAANTSNPSRFAWGVAGAVARDAVLDLLERSATTFSWSLTCGLVDEQCYFAIGEVRILTTGPDGRMTTKMVLFDRCGDCERVKSRAAAPGSPPIILGPFQPNR